MLNTNRFEIYFTLIRKYFKIESRQVHKTIYDIIRVAINYWVYRFANFIE